MPVILAPEDEGLWLALDTRRPRLEEMLAPAPAEGMAAARVSSRVNSPKYDDPGLLEADRDPQQELGF